MKLIMCDNARCKKIININDSIEISIRNHSNNRLETLDLCKDCYVEMIEQITAQEVNICKIANTESEYKDNNNNEAASNNHTELISNTKQKNENTAEINNNTKQKNESTAETSSSTGKIENNTIYKDNSIKEQVEPYNKRKYNHVKSTPAQDKIKAYGIDNIIREYVEEDIKATELAKHIGVTITSLNVFLSTNNIVKYKSNKHRGRRSKADDYGLDRIKKEYIEDGLSIDELAERIGIKRRSLIKYLIKNNIHRYINSYVKDTESVPQETSITENKAVEEIKIDKVSDISTKKVKTTQSKAINIENINPAQRSMLASLEEKTDMLPKACRTCAYRNTTNNYCWYTMVTNKHTNDNGIECKHYIDIRKLEQ